MKLAVAILNFFAFTLHVLALIYGEPMDIFRIMLMIVYLGVSVTFLHWFFEEKKQKRERAFIGRLMKNSGLH